jgi:hypothetical protein
MLTNQLFKEDLLDSFSKLDNISGIVMLTGMHGYLDTLEEVSLHEGILLVFDQCKADIIKVLHQVLM